MSGSGAEYFLRWLVVVVNRADPVRIHLAIEIPIDLSRTVSYFDYVFMDILMNYPRCPRWMDSLPARYRPEPEHRFDFDR